MGKNRRRAAVVWGGILFLAGGAAGAEGTEVKIDVRPLHGGRINPMLFGSFIELLDDLIPGMWAEMLNDRGFEGVVPQADWCYYDGRPNFCDREWDKDGSWTYDNDAPFNGERSAKLAGDAPEGARLAQAGIAVVKGAAYLFSGCFRADSADLKARVVLKTPLPDGAWAELAAAELSAFAPEWKKQAAELISSGTTDRAVFALEVRGKGGLWADKLSLMPAANRDGWREDVVQAIAALRPGVIRWGGSACDPGAYRWKEGIGERDRRRPFPNRVWGRIDSNDVGIDEFCRFCELVRAEPLICISFSDGPQSAADLVEYCNGSAGTQWGAKRAANGRPAPYGVKYWQVGNELGGEAYAAGCPAFCAAMKRADSKIALVASFPSKALLEQCGRDFAYIGPHHYTPNLAECESDFVKLREMINTVPGCAHLRIAVTEWNITAGWWGLMRAKMLTLESALQNARYVNLLMRHAHIADIACRSNMTNSMCSGVIETAPWGLLKRPSYHALKLYAEHAKPIPAGVAGAPEGVDIAACASEDGTAACVFAVNMKNAPVAVSLNLAGTAAPWRLEAAYAFRDRLDRRQLDVQNHWTAPDRVGTFPLEFRGNVVELPAFSATAIECAARP